jgi:hypothetical protein
MSAARGASAQSAPAPVVITPSFSAERYLAARTPIVLSISGPARPGAITIVIGSADVTALFERRDEQWVYRADVVPLPSGESEVAVYLVDSGAWNEVGRFPIKVLTPHGFTKSTVSPAASVNNKGQLAEGRSADQAAPERATFQDVQLATGFQSSQIRAGWQIDSRMMAIGVSNRREALRFGERGDRAPRFDLSDYQLRVQRGPANLSLGSVSLGSNRHLMSGFGSRGAMLGVGSQAVSLAVAALDGSPTVGWDHPLGFTRPSHRVLGSTVAVEMRPQRPGALHVDLTLVDGLLQPRAGFGQNAITDAQRSTGLGVQFSASSPQQRLRVVGGIAESRFVNPPDPLLDGDMKTTEIQPAKKSARYLETSVGLLQNAPLGKGVKMNLNANWRHERVDPLYRSITAAPRADLRSDAFDANATIGALALQASHARSGDNLARIASLLTTQTRMTTTQASLPLAALMRRTASWIPSAAYNFSQSHQFGVGVPVNSGFTIENVPSLVSTVHDASLQWQGAKWRAGYRFNRSFQDNRQPDRVAADLSVATHAMTLGLTATSTLDLNVDLSTERQSNLEQAVHATVQRVGLTTNWRPTVGTGVAASFSASRNMDAPRTEQSGNNELRLELSRALALGRSAQQGARAQAFVRYARQSSNATRFLEPALAPTTSAAWTVASGINFLVF